MPLINEISHSHVERDDPFQRRYAVNAPCLLSDLSRRNSLDQEGGVRETSVVLVRERKLVPVDLVRNGMLRFNFMLESCQPGSVPDPQLIAAVLDLVSTFFFFYS